MTTRILLSAVFLSLFFFAACRTPVEHEPPDIESVIELVKQQSIIHQTINKEATESGTPGAFPEPWICGLECEDDPPIQVQRIGEGLVVLRQSKCIHYEAPFLYLVLGSERALLFDTGPPGEFGIVETVMGLVKEWRDEHDLAKDYELVVAHTHAHFDHIMGDFRFKDIENVTIVGWLVDHVKAFYGIEDWPNQIVNIDLGDRVLDVIPTPGHHPAHIAIYDRTNELLLSGDTLYPGFLFVFTPNDWPVFQASTARLVDFVKKNPVRWILGCHVEMSRNAGKSYPYGTKVHPEERVLELEVRHLMELHDALEALGEKAVAQVHDDFVIYPVWAAKH